MRTTVDSDFEDFVRARSASLLRTAVLLAGDGQDAEDLLQQALWRTHRRWRDAVEHPDAYVRKVLVNLAHDGRRHASRRVRQTPLTAAHEAAGTDATSALLERDVLLTALRELPVRQRSTVVLRFWEDLSVEDTAAALGCTTGTVKSTTGKALARLRGVLVAPAADTESGRQP